MVADIDIAAVRINVVLASVCIPSILLLHYANFRHWRAAASLAVGSRSRSATGSTLHANSKGEHTTDLIVKRSHSCRSIETAPHNRGILVQYDRKSTRLNSSH